MTELVFDEESHTYTLKTYGGAGQFNVRLPSVSEIISPVCSFLGVDPAVLEWKSELGKAVHKLCEWHDRDGIRSIDMKSIDPAIKPYFEAWRKFTREMKPKWHKIEERAAHPLGYAGTLDRLGWLMGAEWVIDIKCVVKVSPATGLQTVAYANLHDGKLSRRGAVQLRPDGTWKLEEFKDPSDWPTFLSLLNLHKWAKKHNVTPNLKKD